MEFLDIPLSLIDGKFRRIPADEAYTQYVRLFFASRKYESLAALDFGIDLDDLSWITSEEYLRVLVEEFNRVHNRRFILNIEGLDNRGGESVVSLVLREGSRRSRIRMKMGSFTGG